MIPSFLGRELCAGLVLDEIAERRLLALELAALVRPVQD
jgi:hypothetical protein